MTSSSKKATGRATPRETPRRPTAASPPTGGGPGQVLEEMEPLKPVIDASIARFFPPELTEREVEHICGRPRYEYDVRALEESIYRVGWELLGRGGKRWRPYLMMLVIEALGKDPSEFSDFLGIPEVIHNGTLIVDDLEDGSELRRGRPTLHRMFGVDIAINAGNTMYYVPLLPLLRARGKLPDALLADLYEIYTQEMINISHGQATDIFWHRGGSDGVSVPQYLQMCAYKSGTLARMAAKFGARLAGADPALVDRFGRFAESVAIAFQIQDDLLNLEEQVGKEYGEDIKEGKRSLLVIRALERLPKAEAKELTRILDSHPTDRAEIARAIALLRKTDAFEFGRGLAARLVKESWADLEGSLPESAARAKLRRFAEFLIQRSH